ncbi:MAG TPA: alpha/beta fold hydrolase [Solirubrobacteraceae bacterium]
MLAYDRTGQGPPLVLLHPLGADRRVWDPIVQRLRGERELIAIDLPGFGDSPPLAHSPSAKALAEAVADQLQAIGLERPHVAGNSLGGWVALELGLTRAVRTVTGISPAGLWPGPLVPKPVIAHNLARKLLPVIGPLAATPPGRRLLLGSAVAHPGRVPAADAAHLVRAYAGAPGFKAVNDLMRAGVFGGLERIRVPVTLVWPERDRLVDRPRWLPDNVDNVVLEDAGHVPMWDAPDALAEILLARTRQTGAVRALRRSA